jgi:hypothetical protein
MGYYLIVIKIVTGKFQIFLCRKPQLEIVGLFVVKKSF